MFKKIRYFIVLVLVSIACSKEEKDTFSSEANTSLTRENIEGIWFVHAGEFMDKVIELNPNFPECGFNHIVFSDNGDYQEILYETSDCHPSITSGNWKVENGIIKVSNTKGEKVEFPVIEFGQDKLVINFRYDYDDDGNQDIFKAYLRPYDRISNNQTAKSFVRDFNENTLLKFNWKQEINSSSFNRYEIYRSSEGECSKENAMLLAKINDINETTFIDYNPPSTESNLCYFLRVYANGVMIGESELLNENPKELIIPSTMNLKPPKIEGETILLEWEKYDIPYFSHYEIVYANTDASSSLFHVEDSITSVNNIKETSFLNTDPPYLENPFFAIYAYNIFGTKIVSNYEQATFRRKDLFGPIQLKHIEIDLESPVIYLHGLSKIPDWAGYDTDAILRLNYDQGIIESTTSDQVYVAGEFPFREPIYFPEGKELVVNGRNNLHFLNPTSLMENFSFSPFYLEEKFDLFGIIDFTFTKNGFLVIIDSSSIFVFQKNGKELILKDEQIHYETHHSYPLFRVIHVNDNKIIIGHKEEEESILYSVDENGLLKDKKVIPLPLNSNYIAKYKNASFYSASSNSLINYGDKTLYSTLSFQPEIEMPEDLFALGLAIDAKYIFASTINPDWIGSDLKTKLLKREILLFDTGTAQVQSIKTKGYPIRVFENNNGELFSLSIPDNQSIDVFVEKIEFP